LIYVRDGGQVAIKATDASNRTMTTPGQAARGEAKRTEMSPAPTVSRPSIPKPTGTYVADSFTGDIAATMGGTFALAHDGEPAGLARVTMAMREPVRKESPAPRRLVGLASWAAILGILGAILAIRDGVGIMIGAPAWFFPTVAAIGIIGVCLTMGAFLTARARTVPWLLLGLASCALLGAFVTTLVGI
jgi:hypothetical protein